MSLTGCINCHWIGASPPSGNQCPKCGMNLDTEVFAEVRVICTGMSEDYCARECHHYGVHIWSPECDEAECFHDDDHIEVDCRPTEETNELS